MTYTADSLLEDPPHQWAVRNHICDLSDENDEVLIYTAVGVREAYGENEILELIEPDPMISENFDLEAILSAFRTGLPDPETDKSKPIGLQNSRSEAGEILACDMLSTA